MAHHLAATADKGPLVPGQTISVNKYSVQIERYLSKGGYAYVYLVRTPTPVHGTTHHVLKRIAVPNEVMLSEVKKEVDIMRILKGHPNIVHLIDAAWHRASNGIFEVFILMEFCPGGGIIDMMNRRLRERLTEKEILQIFVDVCEGVAAMHNLRPALLHRDLKVENILQSSDTLFKLCDFGSATPVARPPASTQEIRALEADLNRHTTLQYRAPEMVDPYLRRPVDEKSDIWALGVLLYKLCYYTTPFEEHGPLAILNVQYKIPTYPVYSSQMNALIASMLREHGAQRPSVFDLLEVVHRMRGTKSRCPYNRPEQPMLPTRPSLEAPSSQLDNLVSYRSSASSSAPQAQPSQPQAMGKNAGVQAREKVLEAIAPMRRGRPPMLSTSRPSSPSKPDSRWADDFGVDEEASWKAAKNAHQPIRGHRSGLTSPTSWGPKKTVDDAWDVSRLEDKPSDWDRRKTFQAGMDGAFGKGFGDSFDGMLGSSSAAAAASASTAPLVVDKSGSIPISIPGRTSSSGTTAGDPRKAPASNKPRDAFYGLGLSTSDKPPAPTLGEARKLRTGLATMSTNFPGSSSGNLDIPGATSRAPAYSPRPSPSPQPFSKAPSPVPPPLSSSWKALSQTPPALVSRTSFSPSPNLTAEERFPSLEDLDRSLLSPGASTSDSVPLPHAASQPHLPPRQPSAHSSRATPSQSQPSRTNFTGGVRPTLTSANPLALSWGPGKLSYDGVRSEQVTGAAMRESREAHASTKNVERSEGTKHSQFIVRPPLERNPPSTSSLRQVAPESLISLDHDKPPSPPRTPSTAQILGRWEPQDWLTGDDEEVNKPPGTPVLRNSPSKRASVMERGFAVPSPQEAVTGQHQSPPSPESPSPSPAEPSWRRPDRRPTTETTPTVKPKPKLNPVDTLVAVPPAVPNTKNESLTENWSPVAETRTPQRKEMKDSSSVSSGDEGPEDVNGTRKVFEFKEKVGEGKRRRPGKGRQSSVHDLVDLWGGGVSVDKKERGVNGMHATAAAPGKEYDEGRDSSSLLPPLNVSTKPRSQSPQPLLPSPPTPMSAKNLSPTRPYSRSRKISTNGVELVAPSPLNISKGRSRPQSMIISSTSIATKPPALDLPPASAGLGLPSDAKARRTTRRTSISDMVQKYEAMGGKPIAPAPAAKPVTKVATHGTSSGIMSPGRTSPMPGARSRSQFGGTTGSLGLPEEGKLGDPSKAPSGLPRTSPVGLPGLAGDKKPPVGIPSGRTLEPPASASKPGFALPRRAPSPAQPVTTNTHVGAIPAEPRTPSPDKPYQGVGRLIDQWQKKTTTEEPGKRGGLGARRGAGVAGGRGR
ncbi:hypothetical protein OF83DRAFT_1246259 [Amylostereum chailletii]|nr:hypothetical protein OF83DRAFT_1246259 [Amylostereum chailletii]